LTPEELKSAAESLHQSRTKKNSREQLTNDYKDLDIAKAYQIQKLGMDLRESDGESIIGMKMGLTSEAKRQQMGLDSPCYGFLTDKMQITTEDSLQMAEGIHPKVEAEVAFYFESPIDSSMTREELESKCLGVGPALEILDTRYTAFKYFSLEDVVADNSSSFKYVLGEVRPLSDVDYKNLTLNLKANGTIAESGQSSAISGDPFVSVLQLLKLTEENGHKFNTPGFVLAGAATPAINLEPNCKYELEIDGFDSIHFQVTE